MIDKFKPCCIPQCAGNAERVANGKSGYCGKHYQRIRKYGDANIVRSTPRPALDWLELNKSYTGGDCLTWPFHTGKDGYGRVHPPGGGTLTTASRQMCLMVHGEPPSRRHEAAHSCGRGDQGCVSPAHLYLGDKLQKSRRQNISWNLQPRRAAGPIKTYRNGRNHHPQLARFDHE